MLKNWTLLVAVMSIGAGLIAPNAASARMGSLGGHGISDPGRIGPVARTSRIDSPKIEVHPRITPKPAVEKTLFCKITKDGGYHHNGCTPWNS